MKRLICCAVLLMLVSSCTKSRRVSVFEVPPENAVTAPVDVDVYKAKYGMYDGAYIYYETTIEHYGNKESSELNPFAKWNYLRMHRSKQIVFNPESERLTSFRIYTIPNRLYLRVTTPDGVVRNYGVADLKEEKDADGDTWHTLVYPDIVPGTIIEEGWEKSYSVGRYPPPLSHDIQLQFTIPCERIKVTYACPNWWRLAIKKLSRTRVVPLDWDQGLVADDKKQMFVYEAKNVSAITREAYAPFFKQVADYLQFQIMELEMKGFVVKRETSWSEFAKKFDKYFRKKKDKHGDKIRDKAIGITKTCTTEAEKIDAILAYVQENITVEGDGRNGDYYKVLYSEKGNIFDLVGVTAELLNQLDIPSQFILVHSAEEGYFDPDYFAFEQFDAPAVRIVRDSGDVLLFPYIKRLPTGFVPPPYQNQVALIMEKGAVQTTLIPRSTSLENSFNETYHLALDDGGLVTVTQNVLARGSSAYTIRELMMRLGPDQMENFVREEMAFSDGEVTVDSFIVNNQDEYNEPLDIDLYYTVDNLVTVMPDEVIFRTEQLFTQIPGVELDADPTKRVNPVSIDYDEAWIKSITLSYPDSWSLSGVMENVTHENEFGSIAAVYIAEPGKLTVDQQVHVNATLQPKAKIGELLDLLGPNTPLSHPTLVFSIPVEEES